VANIYHGVDTEKYVYNPEPKDYFLFLGRITEQKGVHLAIEAARAAKVKLIIAGKSYSNEDYWHKQIEPFIDGVNIRYIGEADNNAKIEYLKNAKALIFPTHANEPFGMVMIEAMSCGTPVIGYKTAAVPEVVKDGKTGYLATRNNLSDFTDKVSRLLNDSRLAMNFGLAGRQRSEKFSYKIHNQILIKTLTTVVKRHSQAIF